MRSPMSVRLIPRNPRTQIRLSVYLRQPFVPWGRHVTSCFPNLTFLRVFEKCWCLTCSTQTHCSEHPHGTCSWGLPCKRIHKFIQVLAALSSEGSEERELGYVMPLYGWDNDNRCWSRKLLSAQMLFAVARIPPCLVMNVLSHHGRLYFSPFNAFLARFFACRVLLVLPYSCS